MTALVFAPLAQPLSARAAVSDHVVISEIQTGGVSDASQEFVELYNPTDEALDLTGWHVDYKSAASTDTSSSWSRKASLPAEIPADGFYLIASKSLPVTADVTVTSLGLAAAGGHVRLVSVDGSVIDLVGWGTANSAEGTAAQAPAAGQSIERLPGERNEEAGNGIDSQDNSADFAVRGTPAPQNSLSDPESPSDELLAPGVGQADQTADVEITELFVNPASPQLDSSDEFIELHNPGSVAADLSGYALKTGSTFSHSWRIPQLSIQPGGYAAVFSSQSHLSLANGGGAAELVAPNGEIVDKTQAYSEAPSGQSWALFEDGWQWTAAPTPGAPNQLSAAQEKTVSSVSGKPAKSKSTKSKSAASSKKKAAPIAADSAASLAATAAVRSSQATGKWLLTAAIAFTIGYGLYEYRDDLRNLYHLSRRKLEARRKGRPTA